MNFMKRVKQFAAAALVSVGLLSVASPAMAAGEFSIDPAPIVTVITSGVAVVSAIGMAVISLVVVIKLFKWVQRVL